MRANARNPLQKVIDTAVRQALQSLNRGSFIDRDLRFGVSTPPAYVTTEGTTGDGDIYTVRTAFTELDDTDDDGALTTA